MNLFNILLAIHILGGGTSLILGLYILVAKKGNKQHKNVGLVYYYAMLASALIAMPMCYLHPNLFLFIISVFTAYMLATGKRYLQKKQLLDVNYIDWALTCIMLIFALAFLFYGLSMLLKQNYFGTVLVVFGIISLLLVKEDWSNFKGHSKIKNYFLTTHISRMMASYIASITAFLVVNNTLLPDTLVWLLPTVCVVPFIFKWTKKYGILKK